MSSDWTEKPLGDVVIFENRRRIPLSAAERAKRRGPYPYWGANGPFDTVDDYLFEGPRVLIAEDGNTVVRADGRGTVHWADGRYWVNNHAHVLNVGPDHDLRWLYYALCAAYVRDFVSGSAQPKLSMGSLKQVPLRVPPLDEQRRIASVLGSLDEKMKSNRRLARQLDACLRELYIAAARKVESRQPLSEVAAHHKASVQPSRTPQAEYEHFSIPAFDTGALSEIAQGADILSGKYTFPDDAVALSKLNPATKRVLVRRSVTDLPAICSSEFVVLRPVNGMTTEVLYAVLAHDGVFYSEVLTGVTGTTGSRQRVNPPHVLQSTVPAFDPEQISSLTDAIRPMHEQIRTLHCEAVRLRAIHEALLPKLVSGQIRVPAHEESLDAEAADLVESPA